MVLFDAAIQDKDMSRGTGVISVFVGRVVVATRCVITHRITLGGSVISAVPQVFEFANAGAKESSAAVLKTV